MDWIYAKVLSCLCSRSFFYSDYRRHIPMVKNKNDIVIELARPEDIPQVYNLEYQVGMEIKNEIFRDNAFSKNVQAIICLNSACFSARASSSWPNCLLVFVITYGVMMLLYYLFFIFDYDQYVKDYSKSLLIPSDYKNKFEASGCCQFWVAVLKSDTEERTVVGAAALGTPYDWMADVLPTDLKKIVEFQKFAVRKDCRRLGIGRKLIKTAMEFTAKRKSEKDDLESVILAWFWVSGPRVSAFYKRLGFVEYTKFADHGPTKCFSYNYVCAEKRL